MSTKVARNWATGKDPNKLTVMEKRFVDELLASDSFNATKAAEAAGYKAPAQSAYALLKRAKVMAALGKSQRERQERCQIKADDVLRYLQNVLYFNPLKYFYPGKNGGWFITDPDSLPEEAGRLIDKMKVEVIENEDGSTTNVFEVELVSKATALSLAMKHIGVERAEVQHTIVRWDSLYDDQEHESVPDVIEATIAEELEG